MSETNSKKRKYVLARIINGEANYWGKIMVDGVEYALCDNPKRVVRGPNYKADEIAIKWSYTKDKRAHEFEIDHTNKYEVEFLDFLKKDTRVFIKNSDKKVTSGTHFELIDVNGDELNMALNIKKRGKLTNLIYSMPMIELIKVCHYFNANIIGKTREGIFNLLLNPENGYFFRTIKIGNKDVVPMDIILNDGLGSEYEIRAAVNKAIITKAIVNRGGVYYLGEMGSPLGSTPEQIYSYMEQNKDVFEGSLQYLLKDETLPESIDYSNQLETVELDISTLSKKKDEEYEPFTGEFTPMQREKWEKEAVELEVQGNIKGFKDETLYVKVTERRKFLSSRNKSTASV